MHLLCFKGLENSKNEVFVSFDTTFFYLCAFIWHIFPFWFIFHLYSHKLCQIRAEMKQGNQIFAQTCFISKIFHSVELWEQKARKDANSTSFLYFLSDASFLPDSNCIISAVQCHKVFRCPILLSHYCPHIPDSALVQSCGLGKCISISDLII